MTCQLYSYAGDRRVMDKSLSAVSTELNIAPYQPVNDLEGIIILGDSYQTANYCRLVIAGKTKYYYIESRTTDSAGRLHCRLREDVLMTYGSAIKKLSGVIARNGSWSDPDLYDPDIQRKQQTQSYMSPVGSAFSYSSRYIFVTVG